jgi:hypothetical protein
MWRSRPLAVLAALVLGACTPHPVGPARTYRAFEGKAVSSAEAALSSVETVRLAAGAGSGEHAFGPYLSVVASEQEDGLAGLQGTFGSIQPPNDEADALRDELDQMLSDALSHLTDVRIAVRRGELVDLADIALPLGDDADALRSFIEDHGG